MPKHIWGMSDRSAATSPPSSSWQSSLALKTFAVERVLLGQPPFLAVCFWDSGMFTYLLSQCLHWLSSSFGREMNVFEIMFTYLLSQCLYWLSSSFGREMNVFEIRFTYLLSQCTMGLSIALGIWNIWKYKGLVFAQFWSDTH